MYSGETEPTRGSSPAFEAVEQERSRQLLEAARSAAGIEAALAGIGASTVGRGPHELAERRGADLLVVGSPSRSLFGRVLMGDDTGRSSSRTPRAVRCSCSPSVCEPAMAHDSDIAEPARAALMT